MAYLESNIVDEKLKNEELKVLLANAEAQSKLYEQHVQIMGNAKSHSETMLHETRMDSERLREKLFMTEKTTAEANNLM